MVGIMERENGNYYLGFGGASHPCWPRRLSSMQMLVFFLMIGEESLMPKDAEA